MAIKKEYQEVFGNCDDRVFGRLATFEKLLRTWQTKINLVGTGTLDDIWLRHFMDSYQLLDLVPDWGAWVDLGSGGGFPGMIVAIASAGQGKTVHLIESDRRKAAFLAEVSRETSVPVHIHSQRIETTLAEICRRTNVDVVSARALAPLPQLLELAEPALAQGALGLFLKGKNLPEELTALPSSHNLNLNIVTSKSDPDGNIVVIRRHNFPTNSV